MALLGLIRAASMATITENIGGVPFAFTGGAAILTIPLGVAAATCAGALRLAFRQLGHRFLLTFLIHCFCGGPGLVGPGSPL